MLAPTRFVLQHDIETNYWVDWWHKQRGHCKNGNFFNWRQLRARATIKVKLLRDLLFADDAAVIVHSRDGFPVGNLLLCKVETKVIQARRVMRESGGEREREWKRERGDVNCLIVDSWINLVLSGTHSGGYGWVVGRSKQFWGVLFVWDFVISPWLYVVVFFFFWAFLSPSKWNL